MPPLVCLPQELTETFDLPLWPWLWFHDLENLISSSMPSITPVTKTFGEILSFGLRDTMRRGHTVWKCVTVCWGTLVVWSAVTLSKSFWGAILCNCLVKLHLYWSCPVVHWCETIRLQIAIKLTVWQKSFTLPLKSLSLSRSLNSKSWPWSLWLKCLLTSLELLVSESSHILDE